MQRGGVVVWCCVCFALPTAYTRACVRCIVSYVYCRYYRELFPLFVAELFISGRFGLNARGAMSALTVCNYLGGIIGGLVTFRFAHKPHKGRHVMYATIAYGTTCFMFGALGIPLRQSCHVLCEPFYAFQ